MKSAVGGEDKQCLCCISHLHLGSFLPSLTGFGRCGRSQGLESSGATQGSAPRSADSTEATLGFGRTKVLVFSCTLQSKEGAEEAWLGAGEGQNLQPRVPRGPVSSPPVQRGLDQFGRLQQ